MSILQHVQMMERAAKREIVPKVEVDHMVYLAVNGAWVSMARLRNRIRNPNVKPFQVERAVDEWIESGVFETRMRGNVKEMRRK